MGLGPSERVKGVTAVTGHKVELSQDKRTETSLMALGLISPCLPLLQDPYLSWVPSARPATKM